MAGDRSTANSELMGAKPTLAVGMLLDFSANLMPTTSVGMAPYPSNLV
jgi:hypothetical protein